MKITINLQFSSKFQKEFIESMLTQMLAAIKSNFEGYHRKNRMDIDIESEAD